MSAVQNPQRLAGAKGTRRRRTRIVLALAATAAATVGTGLASAPAQSQVPAPAQVPAQTPTGAEPSVEVLATAALAEPFSIQTTKPTDAFILHATFPPGTDGGWHTHPGPGFVIITRGTATLYKGHDPQCTPQRFQAGEGFLDEGHTHIVRNEGTEPLELYSIPLVPAGANSGNEAPNPGNCPF